MTDQKPAADARRVAELLARADAGDADVKDALFASLYSELHRLAQIHVHRGGGQLTMGATTLLHEAYLELNSRSNVAFPDRPRFLKYASRVMRSLVIDYVRARQAQKRGGEITFTALSEQVAGGTTAAALQTLSDVLDELAEMDPPLAELVDLKFFCGFSFNEIAAMRGVSERTVQRDWAKARVLLHEALQNGLEPP
jgi:RNA polymerase sigma factor (TIGR02999 family)